MNVDTITVKHDTAMMKIADLKALKKSQRTDEDDALLSLYTSVAKHGARVISLAAAFRQTGLNELGQPKLAIAQADWSKVFYRRTGWSNSAADASLYGAEFDHLNSWSRTSQRNRRVVRLSPGAFVTRPVEHLSTLVPYVPADVRPKFHLRNYHILFEVEKWTVEMPVDPFLLKHIMGDTYAVIAEWELTELEASLLGSMRSGN